MTLWDIVRFTTIRHLWLVTITREWPKPDYEAWIPISDKKCVVWKPEDLHQWLNQIPPVALVASGEEL